MTTSDRRDVASAVGEVFISEYGYPGLSSPVLVARNQMSYAAADAIAAAYGGDMSLVPKFIGFVYGPEDSLAAGRLASGQDRAMDWATLRSQVGDIGGNVQIAEFSSPPSLSAVSDSNGLYAGNAVTFQACTRSGDDEKCAFKRTEGDDAFAGPLDDTHCIYQVLLLGLTRDGRCRGEREYNILARASLAKWDDSNGEYVYRPKPSGYELVLSWRVTFY